MPRIPMREAVYGMTGLEAAVRDAFPELLAGQIERNRVEDIDCDEAHPRFRLFDGDQAPTDEGAAGEVVYLLAWDAEINVQVAKRTDLGPTLNLMHARLVEAVAPGAPIVVATDEFPLELWLEESDIRVEMFGAGETEIPTGVLTAAFRFRVTLPRGEAFVTVPG